MSYGNALLAYGIFHQIRVDLDESFTWCWPCKNIFKNLEAEKKSLLTDKHNQKK